LCPVSLRIPSSSRSPDHDPHRTIYYLGYPLGRFAGLKHRQLVRQVGVIITTRRIRRTFISKINRLGDSSSSNSKKLLQIRRSQFSYTGLHARRIVVSEQNIKIKRNKHRRRTRLLSERRHRVLKVSL
jgi:hypothetical protein